MFKKVMITDLDKVAGAKRSLDEVVSDDGAAAVVFVEAFAVKRANVDAVTVQATTTLASNAITIEASAVEVITNDDSVVFIRHSISREIEMPCLTTFFKYLALKPALILSEKDMMVHVPMSREHGYMRLCMYPKESPYPNSADVVVRFSYESFLYDRNPQNTYHQEFIAQFAAVAERVQNVLKYLLKVNKIRVLLPDHTVFTTKPCGDIELRTIHSDPTQVQLFPNLLTVHHDRVSESCPGGVYRLASDFVVVRVTAHGIYEDGTQETVTDRVLGPTRLVVGTIAKKVRQVMNLKAMDTPTKSIKIDGIEVDPNMRLSAVVFRSNIHVEITISH